MGTNNTQKKKLLLLCFAILIPLLVNGETVCINGIYYNLISKAKQAEVIQGDAWYSGNKTIPPSITYKDTEYTVTSIGNAAFYKCWDLASISIPETVTNIGVNAFNGCSKLNYIKCHMPQLLIKITLSSNYIAQDWVSGVSASGTFYKKSSANIETGNNGIPKGWEVIDF